MGLFFFSYSLHSMLLKVFSSSNKMPTSIHCPISHYPKLSYNLLIMPLVFWAGKKIIKLLLNLKNSDCMSWDIDLFLHQIWTEGLLVWQLLDWTLYHWPPGAEAFGLAVELHYQLSWVSSWPLQILGLFVFHNYLNQFLIIHLVLSIHKS